MNFLTKCIIIPISVISAASAQTTFDLSVKPTDGITTWAPGAYGSRQSYDGGYIVYGDIGYDWDDRHFIWSKIDSLGNQQWDKRYGGTKDDNITSMQQTSDGGYILGATSNTFIPPSLVIMLQL